MTKTASPLFRKNRIVAALGAVAVAGSVPALAHPSGTTCEGLIKAQLPNTIIMSAQSISAGTYQPPGSKVAYTNLPAFCRVTATVSPVPGSSIQIEVWMPSKTWNGKYQQSGNHSTGGTMFWGEMAPQLQRGYATGITNDGHTVPPGGGYDMTWVPGYPERVVDFAYRAVHELASKAKLLITDFYGKSQEYAYFNGCSNGGREGLKNAQMFPHDFNGIIIGGTASNWTGSTTELLVASKNWVAAGMKGPSATPLFQIAQKAETAACDAKDGVVDGVLSDPRTCHWDPSPSLCQPGQASNTCLTTAEAAAFKANERSLRDPVTGRWIFFGQEPASEYGDSEQSHFLPSTNAVGLNLFGINQYQVVLNDPTWDGSTFDLHTDYPILERAFGSWNAVDPDLRPFKRAGGKMIQWHGWADGSFVPKWEVAYYDEVIGRTGHGDLEDVQDFYRLFMLPGVGHCGGGAGPDNIGAENQIAVSHDSEHDIVSALETWVEHGTAPKKLIASKLNVVNVLSSGVVMQRPICPYPSEAVYKGTGDTNVASNFACQRPREDDRRHTVRDED